MPYGPTILLATVVVLVTACAIAAIVRVKNYQKERRLKLFGPPGDDIPDAPLEEARKRRTPLPHHRDVNSDPEVSDPPKPAYKP